MSNEQESAELLALVGRLSELLAKVAQPPWRVEIMHTSAHIHQVDGLHWLASCVIGHDSWHEPEASEGARYATLIVEAVNALPTLLAALQSPPVAGGSVGEAELRKAISEGLDACPHGLHSERITAIETRVRAALAKPTPPASVSGEFDFADAFQMAHDLIQEAKGAEGPNGGFVTNHLDDAESWLYKIEEAMLAAAPEAATPSAVPAAWVSPGQFSSLIEPDEIGGAYLPVRKTKAGNFTQPLYATPSAVGGVDRMREAVIEAARDLVMRPGGLRNNGEHLIVVEKADKSDPHYRLCSALEALASGETSSEKDDRIQAPNTVTELKAIIRKWLDREPATDWGSFERRLDGLISG